MKNRSLVFEIYIEEYYIAVDIRTYVKFKS